jgi:hypothetical protein
MRIHLPSASRSSPAFGVALIAAGVAGIIIGLLVVVSRSVNAKAKDAFAIRG